MYKTFNLNFPIDTIIELKDFIAIGSYIYNSESKNRTGKILFLNKKDKNIITEISTSGTFCLSTYENKIFSANTSDISIFNLEGELICKKLTNFINTYIFVETYILVSNTNGEILIFTKDFNEIGTIKICRDSIWIVKEIDGWIYTGTESGFTYKINIEILLNEFTKNKIINIENYINLEDGLVQKFNENREGIIDFLKIDDQLIVSSYDDFINIYNFKIKLNTIKTGSLWKMIVKNDKIFCASMYEGLKIFDKKFNLLTQYKTNSICYGLCVTNEEVIWSSFYDNCIYCEYLNNIL